MPMGALDAPGVADKDIELTVHDGDLILRFATVTNGEMAWRSYKTMEEKTGLPLAQLAEMPHEGHLGVVGARDRCGLLGRRCGDLVAQDAPPAGGALSASAGAVVACTVTSSFMAGVPPGPRGEASSR